MIDLKSINSPLIKQYNEFKDKYPDSILFMQIGEFFEIYNDDAVFCSSKLDLKLTKRTVEGVDIPMCGIPAKVGDELANKLSSLGKIVTIIRQKKENDTVVRYVDRTITPATVDDDTFIDSTDQQIMMCLYSMKDNLGCAMVDYTTGEVITTLVRKFNIFDLIQRYRPKETYLYLPINWEKELIEKLKNSTNIIIYEVPYFYNEMKQVIDNHKNNFFNGENIHYSVIAAHYFLMDRLSNISDNQVTLRKLKNIDERNYLYLHSSAISGLELLENMQTKKSDKTLYSLLNETATAKGSRTLKKWIQEPLLNPKAINYRYAFVSFFSKNFSIRNQIHDLLLETSDVERILGRIESNRFKDFELVSFKNTLEKYEMALSKISEYSELGSFANQALVARNNILEMLQFLNTAIDDKLIIKEGFDCEFDVVRDAQVNGKEDIYKYFENIKSETGIKNIKLEENKVLGYFISVTKSNLNLVPDYFIERGSVSSGKRFVTEELKTLEDRYINACEEYNPLYKKALNQVRNTILPHIDNLRSIFDFIAAIDVLIGFSIIAEKFNFHKPELVPGGILEIEEGKHPLLNRYSYLKTIPNDCSLNINDIQVITGPNMGGKSTYLKMVATLVIMAQVGSFVPAIMRYTPVDRVLVRIGASDYMLNNQSTFMMEMEETSYILYHATKNSLIIIDELGRGTSTDDGIAIAKSVLSFISNKIKAKTICSTHYHELIEFAETFNNMHNYHVDVLETNDGLEFTFKIKQGGISKSFGILVAEKAGLPREIISLANKYLSDK